MVNLKGLPNTLKGIAWPSSVRAVRRFIKLNNEQDLSLHLLSLKEVLCKDR